MTRRIAAFGIGSMLGVLCGVAGAQTNKTLLPSAGLAPQPPGIVAGAPPTQGAACTIRFVTLRGPMAASSNNPAGWVSCLQVNHSSAGAATTTLMAQGSSGGPITQRQSGGSMPGSAPIRSKSPGRSQFEAVTVQRGVTPDPAFAQWGNSAQAPTGHVISQSAPVPSAALTPSLVGATCAKDPSLRILGVAGSTAPVMFFPGHTYTIWGCSFGPGNPNNAVYLSDGSSFTWYLQKTSWSNNSVVASVSTAPKSPKNNLMLFVVGQNGNTKLNGVTLQ